MNDFDMGKRYPALSAIVVVIKIVAVLVAILGPVAAFLAMGGGYGVVPGIGIMVGVVVAFVIMWAAAESIAVIIDIEANNTGQRCGGTNAASGANPRTDRTRLA